MKAARFYGREDIRIEDVPEPKVRPGTVKLKVDWCGICGTDLHEFLEGPIFIPPKGTPHPLTGEELPITMGHEFAGTIVEVGKGVAKGLKEGDRVAVEPYHTCGTCPACRVGRYNVCSSLGFIGLSGGGGGFSEFCVVDAHRAHPLGALQSDVGALVEPLAVAHHAVRLSGAKAGQTAVVFGCGPIGLVVTAALRAAGIDQVVAVEPAAPRRAKATGAGADLVLDPTKTDIASAVLDMTDGAGADVAFECAGIDAVLAQAIRTVRVGGKVVNVAIWGHPATVQMNDLVMKEVSILGTLAYCDDHPDTIALLADGRVDAAQFITKRVALDDLVEEGFRQLLNNVKILVHP